MLDYGQQEGGTHPTGMHSCLELLNSHQYKQIYCFQRIRNPIIFGRQQTTAAIEVYRMEVYRTIANEAHI